MVSLTVYDGAMGIGGNKLYLKECGKGVLAVPINGLNYSRDMPRPQLSRLI